MPKLITPLEGPADPDSPHVTVPCSLPGCSVSFFVSKHHPALPDGPFFCVDHRDVETSAKEPDHVTLAVLCDRCDAQLIVEAKTREEAREKLRAAINDAQWHVVDRFEGAFDTATEITGKATSRMLGALDLCSACAKTQL
jgi:hypothetical protein